VQRCVNVGVRVFNLAVAPGAVWAVANLTSTVSRIGRQTGRITATVHVGASPYDVEWGFGSAWVSNAGDATLSRITGTRVVKTVKVGIEPNGLSAIGAAAGSLWVSEERNIVARVDPATLKVLARVPVKRNPLGSAVVNGKLWVPCIDAGAVVVIDPRAAKVVRSFPAGPGPIVVLPTSEGVWISHTTGNAVWRIRE
jgi:streptogramin lyase